MATKTGTHKRRGGRCKHTIKTGTRCKFSSRVSGYCSRHEPIYFPDGGAELTRVEQPVASVPMEFYADAYTEEELAGLSRADMEASTLDAEIRLIRTQLRRVSKQIKQVETGDADYDPLQVFASEQEIDDIAVGADGRPIAAPAPADGKKPKGSQVGQTGTLKRKTSRRAPDLYARQDTLMRRLERYIRLRAELQNQGTGTSDPGELGREMREAFDQLGEVAAGKNPTEK